MFCAQLYPNINKLVGWSKLVVSVYGGVQSIGYRVRVKVTTAGGTVTPQQCVQ